MPAAHTDTSQYLSKMFTLNHLKNFSISSEHEDYFVNLKFKHESNFHLKVC